MPGKAKRARFEVKQENYCLHIINICLQQENTGHVYMGV